MGSESDTFTMGIEGLEDIADSNEDGHNPPLSDGDIAEALSVEEAIAEAGPIDTDKSDMGDERAYIQDAVKDLPVRKIGLMPNKKYKPEFCQQLVDYFDVPITETKKVKKYDTNGKSYFRDVERAVSIPHFSTFAKKIGVDVMLFKSWDKTHPEWKKAHDFARELQKRNLVDGALLGKYQASFAIFAAKNYTDMRDRVEVDQRSLVQVQNIEVKYED